MGVLLYGMAAVVGVEVVDGMSEGRRWLLAVLKSAIDIVHEN
jgi:hypothetical protein